MSDKERFELNKSDGKGCAQVHVLDSEDLEYWTNEAREKGYLMGFDYHVYADHPVNYDGIPYDVYQIYPPELEERFEKQLGIINIMFTNENR